MYYLWGKTGKGKQKGASVGARLQTRSIAGLRVAGWGGGGGTQPPTFLIATLAEFLKL